MHSFLVMDGVRNFAVGHGTRRPDDVVPRAKTAGLGDAADLRIRGNHRRSLTVVARKLG